MSDEDDRSSKFLRNVNTYYALLFLCKHTSAEILSFASAPFNDEAIPRIRVKFSAISDFMLAL